ncbi:acyl-CoA dehydrogenase [Salipaludibacillus keqinensis]|uniref:Acyl-CoA dehydrogenase n=1 Tax=Salipaludibacillus keqinensis TaxID=2045207 RepID=A0A323TS12_9BACI|nr:acyl-CoA dehydrogenase family protein [Salipaludibacillus keqinensis]PYZ92185.1 acyl-CoA dehydrogenase [Salipaludibacillus keqinensis]
MSKQETKLNISGGSFLLSSISEREIFTPEDFNEEHKMIAQTAKQFVEREVEPHRHAIEEQHFDRVVDILHKAGDVGLLGHSISSKHGGLGLDKVSKGIVGEALGKTGGYGVAHSNHTCIATLPITYFGSEEQKKKYLPKLASGEYIGAYCLTEPSAGSDALAAKTTAQLNEAGTHYVLNGTKLYITNAIFSNTFIVYAKVDREKFTAFIVERDYPGLSLGSEEKKMGIKGSSTRSVILEDCLVPVENVLGEVGRGHVIALNVLNLGRFNLGSACMGAAKYALELALSFTNERKQFNNRIADFGATKEKIATMAARIYSAESLQYRTAGLLEDALADLYEEQDQKLIGKRMMEYVTECAICKVYSSETLDYVVDEALQLHGGSGFISENRIEQMYRDSRINRIFEGTNEINRLIIPRLLFKKAALGEIPIQDLIQEAKGSLGQNGNDVEGPLKEEKQTVATMRRIFLILAGVTYETLGDQLEQEQETIMKLSEIAILLYATESAVYRSAKAIANNGEDKEQLKQLLAFTVVDQANMEVEMLARQLLSGILSGAEREKLTQLITTETRKYKAEGSVAINREIAAFLNEAQKYTC